MVEDFSCPYPRCGCRDWRPGREEVGGPAAWSLSSCKSGRCGALQLAERRPAAAPRQHPVLVEDHRQLLGRLHYTDCKLDESHTHTRTSVRVGTNFTDLQEVEVGELQ